MVIVCVLISCVFISELPENITLTDDTSNDFIVRGPALGKTFQMVSFTKQACEIAISGDLLQGSAPHRVQSVAIAPPARSLLLLLSVLRT